MSKPTHVDQSAHIGRQVLLLATDRSGSIIGETVNGNTEVIAYSAYGERSARPGSTGKLGFNGQVFETHIGWYLLGNGYRAYNPRLMRFHSPDSWSPFRRGGLNPYMYCVGDPVNRSDPTGHAPLFPWLPHGLRKTVSRTVDFLFGGSSMTGANRGKAITATATVESVVGPMRPEKENILKAFGTLGTIVGGAPGARRHPGSMGLDMGITTPKHHPGYAAGAARDALTHRSSPSAPQASEAISGRHGSAAAPHQLPPSYTEAVPLWNADTFAASHDRRSYTVNSMSSPRENHFANSRPRVPTAEQRALEMHQAQMAAQHAAQQAQLQAALAALDNLQQDAAQLRATNRICRIL